AILVVQRRTGLDAGPAATLQRLEAERFEQLARHAGGELTHAAEQDRSGHRPQPARVGLGADAALAQLLRVALELILAGIAGVAVGGGLRRLGALGLRPRAVALVLQR